MKQRILQRGARDEPAGAELDRVARDLLKLQRGLTGDRALAGSGYMDDPDLARAYRLFYWPVSRAQAERVLQLSGLRPISLLDVGSGSGALADAAAGRGATRLFLVDGSRRALDLAEEILAARAGLSVGTAVADLEAAFQPPDELFDCAAFGHCLNELWQGKADRVARRADLVERVGGALAPDGAVIVIEPSALGPGRDALALRDELERQRWRIVAPCTRPGPCSALSAGLEQTCRDDVPWEVPPTVRELARRIKLDKEVLKMTWFVAIKPNNEAQPTAPDLPRSPERYRVVSEAMLNKAGRVRYLLCGPGGRFGFSARIDDQRARAGGFFDLKRGDLVTVADPEMRESGWGFGANTGIAQRVINQSDGDRAI